MRWLDRFLGRERDEKMNSLELFREVFGHSPSKSGQQVSVKTALQVATVFACARVIADGIAQVPLKLFRLSPDGRSRTQAVDHPLYVVLHRRPNPWQTSYRFRETMGLHLTLCGNFFAFINRVRGNIVELLPIEPGLMTVKRSGYETRYLVRQEEGGPAQEFPAEAIWHVRGPSWNSWMGLEVLQLARDAIGLSMAIEEQQSGFYRQGTSVPGVLSVDGMLQPHQYKQLREWLEKEHAGAMNSGRPMIIDRAAKWMQMAMSSADAQTLEQRRMQVEEICRAFRVMPIMVGFADKTATYASAEQMFLAHLVHTLAPWYERIEQEIDAFLLKPADVSKGIYAKFIEEGLLRGALKDTADYLQRMTAAGIMTRNEARGYLEMDPLPGLDAPLTPVNMVAGDPPTTASSSSTPAA